MVANRILKSGNTDSGTNNQNAEQLNTGLCPKSISDFNNQFGVNESINNSYRIVNIDYVSCLYGPDSLVALPYTLQYYEKNNFFGIGKNYPEEKIVEWFKYEDDNKLYIYLNITLPPGDSYLDKHILVIDLKNKEISGEIKDSPYIEALSLSPNKKHSVELDDKKLHLYNFVLNIRQGLVIDLEPYMKIDNEKIYDIGLQDESGLLLDGAISWINDQEIQIQLFAYTENGLQKYGEPIVKKLTTVVEGNACENKIKYFYDRDIESDDYNYTDAIVNKYTGEKYMIRRSNNDSCGRNGSLCDLVVGREGEKLEIIADLLFPTCELASDGTAYLNIKNRAELLEFVDKDNLLISFGEYGHCVNDSSVASYNLKTKELTNNLLSFSGVEKSCWDKGYAQYDICKMASCLTFSDKITFKKDGKIVNVQNDIKFPYEVGFEVKANYQNTDVVYLVINKEVYTFNFNTGALIPGK
jgi:hypothetical protein